MDIRNIKSEKYTGKYHLEFMFKKGIEQLGHYLTIEQLPQYPLDINTRKSQVVLKDFIGRVIEELAEGYESLLAIKEVMVEHGWNLNRIINDHDTVTYNEILNMLQNANEEQADAMGFFISLLVYSNILPDDIYEYAYNKTADHVFKSNDFGYLMAYGVSELYRKDDEDTLNESFILFDEGIAEDMGINYDKVNSYTPGFHKLSLLKLDEQMKQLWTITYNLNIARNLLKNRPWKQTPVMSKELDFQESLVKSFIYYLGYLAYNGFEPQAYTNLFYRKQQLNLWRIKTGY